jgi:predicted  nucleic acid-binding Zn-ribbon protein
MGEMLDDLRKLQDVEIQLAEIRRNREAKERRSAGRRKQVQKVDESLEQSRRAIRDQQVRLDSVQLDITSREESIARHRQALNKAKTNKEYAAVLAAMNTEKADNTKVETTMMELMKEIESASAKRGEIEAERAKLLEEVGKADEALREYDRGLDAQRTRLEAERDEIARHIPPTALEAFKRAASRHDGEAMAAVVRPRPKMEEFNCAGCNIKVTLEIVSALNSKGDIQLCGSCGRILYLEQVPARR